MFKEKDIVVITNNKSAFNGLIGLVTKVNNNSRGGCSFTVTFNAPVEGAWSSTIRETYFQFWELQEYKG